MNQTKEKKEQCRAEMVVVVVKSRHDFFFFATGHVTQLNPSHIVISVATIEIRGVWRSVMSFPAVIGALVVLEDV